MSDELMPQTQAQPAWTDKFVKNLSKSRLSKIFGAQMTFLAFKDNLKPWNSFFNPVMFSKPT
jgi:hypothetical protein